ncbi:MAG: hypothetical protein R2712_23475 [Vicinamibacterales bacterium]
MVPAHRIIPGVLAHIIRPAPLCQEKVDFAWRVAVGPAIGRVTRARIDDRRVLVVVAGSPWRREVERSLGLIRSRLDTLLGPDAFISVEITSHD